LCVGVPADRGTNLERAKRRARDTKHFIHTGIIPRRERYRPRLSPQSGDESLERR